MMRRISWIPLAALAWLSCATDGSPVPSDGSPAPGDEEVVQAHVREVRFVSAAPDGFEHVGNLYVPEWRVGERLPAVAIAHGSGPNSRDGELPGQLGMPFGFSIAVYRQLAEALQAAGYVVLTYDKRTCGKWNGCANNDYEFGSWVAEVTVRMFSQDFEGALRFLAKQPEVDPERLFAIGHSKGALYVPDVMRRLEGVRAGVMLAGTYSDITDILAYQVEYLERQMREAGFGESTIDQQLGPIRLTVEALRELQAGTWGSDPIQGLPVAYWQSLLDLGREARENVPSLDRPILVISGDKDTNVPPSETEAWMRALDGTIHPVKILPSVTHALNCMRDSGVDRNVSDALVEAIIKFLNSAEK